MVKPSGWSQTKAHNTNQKPRLNTLVDVYDFSTVDGKYSTKRPVGPIIGVAVHWIRIVTNTGKTVSIPKYCLDYDVDNDSFPKKPKKCPYCKNHGLPNVNYYQNMIDRDSQDSEPAKKAKHTKTEKKGKKWVDGETYFFKDPESKSWTPVSLVAAGLTLSEKLRNITQLNKGNELNDPKNGMDIDIMYDSKQKTPGAQWDVQRAGKSKLKPKESAYLLYDVRTALPYIMESPSEAEAEWEKLKDRIAKDKGGKNGKRGGGKGGKNNRGRRGNVDMNEENLPNWEGGKSGKQGKKKKKRGKK